MVIGRKEAEDTVRALAQELAHAAGTRGHNSQEASIAAERLNWAGHVYTNEQKVLPHPAVVRVVEQVQRRSVAPISQ